MTHNDKVLALLSDGKPHTHHEIYGLFVIGHSRIADLRKRGHVIEMWRDGDDYLYQLCSEEGSPSEPSAAEISPSSADSEQLSLAGIWKEALRYDQDNYSRKVPAAPVLHAIEGGQAA